MSNRLRAGLIILAIALGLFTVWGAGTSFAFWMINSPANVRAKEMRQLKRRYYELRIKEMEKNLEEKP